MADPSPHSDLVARLVDGFRWVDPGPTSTHLVSDVSGWWRDPQILSALGPALVAPFRTARPTVVVAPAVTGLIVGPLAATALGVGFTPAHKRDDTRARPGRVTWATGPPDFRGRRVELGIRDDHLHPGDRVLVVDDWVATGAQLRAVAEICAARRATVVGTAAVVADAPDDLQVTALLHPSDLV
ncbi:phosphoribosyltransferase family protein [Micromonospora sp. NPDC000207]|uniref:phosphoribosyltransferase family protein n=1 Tax=Micromonospora sp. NPDC000207 TaxID=3154246 RepID=UPI00332076E0